MNTEAIRKALAMTRSDITDDTLVTILCMYYRGLASYPDCCAREEALAFIDRLALVAAHAAATQEEG